MIYFIYFISIELISDRDIPRDLSLQFSLIKIGIVVELKTLLRTGYLVQVIIRFLSFNLELNFPFSSFSNS